MELITKPEGERGNIPDTREGEWILLAVLNRIFPLEINCQTHYMHSQHSKSSRAVNEGSVCCCGWVLTFQSKSSCVKYLQPPHLLNKMISWPPHPWLEGIERLSIHPNLLIFLLTCIAYLPSISQENHVLLVRGRLNFGKKQQ